jgi:glycosyltransferase involved in cell wall biosynthesis
MTRLGYVAVTPACNEAENLPRLADSLAAQAHRPSRWIIVENGSTDETPQVALELAAAHPWITVLSLPGVSAPERGWAVVRAISAAIEAIDVPPDLLVNVDADVSMAPDYFSRLVAAFESNPSLGIASGTCYELHRGEWQQQHTTRDSLWGASRMYRWVCLQDVLPFEPRIGWDGIDELKANSRGWQTRTLTDLPFRHHRREGERDGARARHWRSQGELAHFMGYRLPYLLVRTLFRARRDPSAVWLLVGYTGCAARREPRYDDARARAYLRSQQQLSRLPLRAREALGRTSS